MNIPEPPNGTTIALISNFPGEPSMLFSRCDEERGPSAREMGFVWLDSNDVGHTWREVCEAGTPHLIGSPVGSSVTPDQLQDGKRYRITIEGLYNHYWLWNDSKTGADTQGRPLSLIESYGIENAARIEAI